MSNKYCSTCFRTGEELDEALQKALKCDNNAARAEAAANRAEEAAANLSDIVCTASGDVVAVKDSAERPLRGLNIYGKTTQVQSTGEQLLHNNLTTSNSKKGVVLTKNGDWFSVVGTPETGGAAGAFYLRGDIILEPGTYTLSVDTPLPFTLRFSNTKALVLPKGQTSVTSTITADYDLDHVAISYTAGAEYNVIFRLMLNKGDTALPFEPYTGGIPVPTPDNPQELENVGADGELVVSVADGTGESVQTLNVSTPNGLPGVPVERGGNYTDENGQQWLCDEINFKRGVYIKRCAVDVLDLRYNEETDEYSGGYYNYDKEDVLVEDADGYEHQCVLVKCKYTGVSGAFCNALPITTDVSALGAKDCLYIGESSGFVVSLPNYSDDFWLAALTLTTRGTPITVIRGMTSEYWTETPLTAEQLAEYAKLYSYYPSTIVTNDEDAGMAVEYVADTKNYIDNKFAALMSAVGGGA